MDPRIDIPPSEGLGCLDIWTGCPYVQTHWQLNGASDCTYLRASRARRGRYCRYIYCTDGAELRNTVCCGLRAHRRKSRVLLAAHGSAHILWRALTGSALLSDCLTLYPGP